MGHRFPELVIGGVMVAPFVTYTLAALALCLLLRPVLLFVCLEDIFVSPPVVLLCVYVVILAILIVLF
jgi:hypothetical protein